MDWFLSQILLQCTLKFFGGNGFIMRKLDEGTSFAQPRKNLDNLEGKIIGEGALDDAVRVGKGKIGIVDFGERLSEQLVGV